MAHKAVVKVELLSGWKEIANYLNKGIRTVQRYERELGLPVRRPAGRSRGAVIATKAELDGWITAAPFRNIFRLPQQSVPDTTRADAVSELHRQVAEMKRLRVETTELRKQLQESVELLRRNLHFTLTEGSSPEDRVLVFPSKKVQ